MMKTLIYTLSLLLLATGCSHNQTNNHYSCSWETTEEAYENCMEVSRGIDEQTARSAGGQEKSAQ
ncbi:hypothetical protein [Gilvimarinus algae]|uniref:Uncharacterized protein n=1 Tax=Gilvimarinus algae TaxID=3058037 RepID=A0ABT8TFA3_9GAMM|nr:hypothetical protein [Gilvimarinus sp. SDUM040014]MDO3381778.1 hypothetical protein [Gilvimarinus sp. SDUM040014]